MLKERCAREVDCEERGERPQVVIYCLFYMMNDGMTNDTDFLKFLEKKNYNIKITREVNQYVNKNVRKFLSYYYMIISYQIEK